ncbi:MAG: hypothetical protein AAF559_13695 [Pseudomonadota bacterium]
MSKVTLNLAAGLAAIGLALAPAAANAKTRASDSQARYTPAAAQSAQSQPGEGRAAKGEKIVGGADFLVGFLVGLWAGGIVVIAADVGDSDNQNQSPGAN